MSGKVWRICLAVLWITSSVWAKAKGPPVLRSNYENIIRAKPGDEIRLSCPVIGGGADILIEWTKDDEQVSASWSRFRKSGTVLRIHEAISEDSGTYICRAINGFGATQADLYLIVKDDDQTVDSHIDVDEEEIDAEPLSFTEETLSQPRLIQVTSKSNLVLRCDVRGYPLADITWMKDGHALNLMAEDKLQSEIDVDSRISKQPLVIARVSSGDSGRYTCLARSLKGQINITFHVLAFDSSRILATQKEVEVFNATVETGRAAGLLCLVQSETWPRIQWLKKLRPQVKQLRNSTFWIGDSEYDELAAQETIRREDGIFLSKLSIPQARESDSGTYACLRTNSKGVYHQTAYLSIVPYLGSHRSSESRSIPVSVMVALPASILLIIAAAFICWLRMRRKRQLEASGQIAGSVKHGTLKRLRSQPADGSGDTADLSLTTERRPSKRSSRNHRSASTHSHNRLQVVQSINVV